MTSLTIDSRNRDRITTMLTDDAWIVACLCAAWCDVCNAFRPDFEALAARYPDCRFIWIDIEDQADMLGDIDVENFPTLLMQRGDNVAFFGTVEPERRQVERLLQAQLDKSATELQAEALDNPLRQAWQRDCNLRRRLRDARP